MFRCPSSSAWQDLIRSLRSSFPFLPATLQQTRARPSVDTVSPMSGQQTSSSTATEPRKDHKDGKPAHEQDATKILVDALKDFQVFLAAPQLGSIDDEDFLSTCTPLAFVPVPNIFLSISCNLPRWLWSSRSKTRLQICSVLLRVPAEGNKPAVVYCQCHYVYSVNLLWRVLPTSL